MRRYAYPAKLEALDDGSVMVSLPDVPECLTYGEDREEAIHHAEDALQLALGLYVEAGKDLPPPSAARGRPRVAPSPLVQLKLAIYEGMRAKGLTQSAFARAMGVDRKIVQRLLDLDHASHMSHVDLALRTLGQKAIVEVTDQAA